MNAAYPTSATPAADADSQWSTLCVVATTMDSEDSAQALARLLVGERAAACVQVEPIVSHYVWQAEPRRTSEWRLVCKTMPDALPWLTALLRRHHGYEVPQITMRTERCLADYAGWVAGQVVSK